MLKHIGDYKVGKYGRHYVMAIPADARDQLQFDPARKVRIYIDAQANALVYSFAVPTAAKGRAKAAPGNADDEGEYDDSDSDGDDDTDDGN